MARNQKHLEDMKHYLFDKYHDEQVNGEQIPWEQWNADWECVDCSDTVPYQENGVDCGVFTLITMSLLAQGIEVTPRLYSQSMVDRQKCRLRIAYLLWQHGGR